jgi:hypothetical protein
MANANVVKREVAEGNEKRSYQFVGKVWPVTQKEDGKKRPLFNITKDRDFATLLMDDNVDVSIWPNTQRTGINPDTGKEYNDAPLRLVFSNKLQA